MMSRSVLASHSISTVPQDVRPPANVYSYFENTAGKIVEMTVGPNPDGSGSRKVQVVPVESEGALRNRDWVEGNLKKVDAATGGKLRFCLSGGAGLKREVKELFHGAGLLIVEGYGLTEASPTLTMNRPSAFRFDLAILGRGGRHDRNR